MDKENCQVVQFPLTFSSSKVWFQKQKELLPLSKLQSVSVQDLTQVTCLFARLSAAAAITTSRGFLSKCV